MKFLVTGATGFLGSHLCKRLVSDGHQVTALRRPTSKVSALAGLAVHFAVGDITDPEAVERAVEGQEAVIHAAADVSFQGKCPEEQIRVNVQGAKNIAQACRRKGVKRLVHVSSIAAVGIPSDSQPAANEEFRFNLEGSGLIYHLSKRRAEEEVIRATDAIDAVVVNPALIFGPAQDRYQGEQALQKTLKGRIIVDGPGGRCLVHVSDVVDGILLAFERGQRGQRYILGGDNVSFCSITEIVCKHLALRRIHIALPGMVAEQGNKIKNRLRRAVGAQLLPKYERRFCNQFYDSTKARRELGYIPRSFDYIVEEWAAYSGLRAVG